MGRPTAPTASAALATPPAPTASAGHVAVPFRDVFERMIGGALTVADVRASFEAILAGAWTSVQIASFAVALRQRGETDEMLVAAAEALRSVMSAVDHGLDEVVDTCGTGGDGAHTLNVSTAAAIVVASTGTFVAKHGNVSVSSRSGSADVVRALGVPVDLPPTRQARVLREARIAFLLAPAHHPALRHAAQARRELGVRTIFNALGPLVNPARSTHQLVGVYDDALRPRAASALHKLGVRRAWVVRSEDGLDEISPAAPTRVSVVDEAGVHERVVVPEDFGFARTSLACLRGGEASDNAAAIVRVLEGRDHPAKEAIAMNAAAALSLVRSADLRACVEEALAAIDSGRARATLEAWKDIATRALAEESP